MRGCSSGIWRLHCILILAAIFFNCLQVLVEKNGLPTGVREIKPSDILTSSSELFVQISSCAAFRRIDDRSASLEPVLGTCSAFRHWERRRVEVTPKFSDARRPQDVLIPALVDINKSLLLRQPRMKSQATTAAGSPNPSTSGQYLCEQMTHSLLQRRDSYFSLDTVGRPTQTKIRCF